MNYFLSKKFLLLFLALGVTAILVGLVVAMVGKNRVGTTASTYQAPYSDQKQDVTAGEIPRGMPSTVPMEDGAKILENSNTTTSNNALQATRIFESTKTLAENFAIYEKYLIDNNWSIVTRINDSTNKVLAGRSGPSTLQIGMDQDPQTKVVKVSIYYVQPINSQQ